MDEVTSTPVSQLLCNLEAKAKQGPKIESGMAAAARGIKEETDVQLFHCA